MIISVYNVINNNVISMWFFHLQASRNEIQAKHCLLNGNRIILFSFTKKRRQKTLKNDRPVSLLPICGKILERLLFKEMFFIEIKLISSNQSDFKSGESCINQLLSTSNEIYEFFDVGLEVRSLDISFLIYQKYLISFDMMVSFSN